MNRTLLHALAAASALCCVLAADRVVSVHLSGCDVRCTCVITPGIAADAVATAVYVDSVNSTGWGVLTVTGPPSTQFNSTQVAFAAGCAEAITQPEMYAYWSNYAAAEYGAAGPSAALVAFMTAQLAWTRAQIATPHTSDPERTFWAAAALLQAQFDGLVAAYASIAPAAQQLDEVTLYMLNSVGDLEDLNGLFSAAATAMPLKDKLLDCSALVKLSPDGSDVLVGHTTWRSYYAMLRIYKLYDFSFTPSPVASFSSSPGLLHSKDDFYVVPPLISMETTNSVFNHTLYDLGTYNNQWMVVDTRAFVPMQPPPTSGLLWIIEQIPGFTQAGDVTPQLLAKGFWSSYNIPYFVDVFNMSGYPAQVEKYGAQYTYENCSRALIFDRNATDVTNMTSLRALLRYNDFQNDPLSGGDPILGSVSSRGDLRASPVAFGGVDTKIVSVADVRADARSFPVGAESGPTHDQQVVFAWDAFPSFDTVQHDLVPARFGFETVNISLAAAVGASKR